MRPTAMTVLLCVLAACVGCGPGSYGTGEVLGSGKYFTIALEQGARVVPIHAHQARLAKEPFTVVIIFPQVKGAGVMVNVSLSPKVVQAVQTGKTADSALSLAAQGLTDDMFNPRQRVYVNDTGYNYWYYFSDKIHRFDDVTESRGKYICKRTIAYHALNYESPSMPIDRLPGDALYLVFVKQDLDRATGRRVEIYADHLTLLFD